MRLSLARFSEPLIALIGFISFVVLWVSACSLVWTQYRVRLLFAEIERAGEVSRRLADESSQLALDLSRDALPAAVNARARTMGYAPAELSDTVLIDVSPDEMTKRHLEVHK